MRRYDFPATRTRRDNGFAAGDVNLSRYVGNGATNATDPSGLVADPPNATEVHTNPPNGRPILWGSYPEETHESLDLGSIDGMPVPPRPNQLPTSRKDLIESNPYAQDLKDLAQRVKEAAATVQEVGNKTLDGIELGLDIVGMVEPWGAPADLANVVLNLLRNRPEAAAASATCMLGGGVVGVLIKRGGRLADDIVENAPKSGWPKGIRKQKPYTAAEICARDCVKDAARIRDALGRGEINRIDTPLGDRGFIGEIRLPNGETIAGDTFRFHEVLFDGERVYDAITGPQGMLLDDYKNMFDQSLVDLLFRHSRGIFCAVRNICRRVRTKHLLDADDICGQ